MLVHNAGSSALFTRTVVSLEERGKQKVEKDTIHCCRKIFLSPQEMKQNHIPKSILTPNYYTQSSTSALTKLHTYPLYDRNKNVKEIIPGSKES